MLDYNLNVLRNDLVLDETFSQDEAALLYGD